MTNKIIYGVIGVVVLAGAFFIGKSFSTTTVIGGAVSLVGVSNNSGRLASVTMAPLTAAATTTSILNSGGTDRAITSSFAYCTGVGTSNTFITGAGLAALQLQMATTSTGGGGLLGNTNYASNLTVATSSAWSYVASTTEATPNYMGRLWPANSYLSIAFNATNTAACTVGVNYLSL